MKSLSDRNPVVLVHGIWDTTARFKKMSAHLTEEGWLVRSLNLIPNDGICSLDLLAKQLAGYIERTFEPDRPFDLIGFSMGGLVSRYYIQRLGGIDRVQRFITLSSPHHGTLTAYSLPLPGYLQMRPGSAFLQDLNQDIAMLQRINFTTIWTPFDAMIVPASSSRMPVGREITLKVWLHHQMVTDEKSLQTIVQELEAPLQNA